ncbi:hypothetical protein M404DRAFT_620931 [Pisolithus tinctorius Marx 270]|uniref:Uncharacterized protein n=1 Tax=Pisolithus tinctorius Marx 270 TaxID=870435 RepID=A0A0C3NRH5_PISTI|nr:hypothetical protein M404DRAFT_620931 [Pisolithus tinctorius Marx 270]
MSDTINSHVGVMAFGVLNAPFLSFSLNGTNEKAILVLCLVSICADHIGTLSNFLHIELSKLLGNVFERTRDQTHCRGFLDRLPRQKKNWHSDRLGGGNSDVGFAVYQGVDDSILAWLEGVRHDEYQLSTVYRLCKIWAAVHVPFILWD